MRKNFSLLLISGLFIVINNGCKKDYWNKHNLKADLQEILDQQQALYKTKFPGKTIGFGLYVKSAESGGHGQSSQDVYVSSGFPKSYGEDIHFRGASTTKSFTAAAILKLHQLGKLNIDDLITDNIPGANQPYIPATSGYEIPYKDKITIRLLLQHRAGVFDVTNTDIPANADAPYAGQRYFDYVMANHGEDYTFSFPELIGVVAENKLSYFEPGAAFHYSNTGYNMLATIIERVSGKRYHQFLQDEFLTPLQMKNTHFPYLGTDQDMPTPYVTGWLKFNNDFTEIDRNNVSFAVSEGNIITTPGDLAIWANALYATNTILNADLHTQMITGIPTNEEHVNYGLGTELNPPDIGYGHNGARPAYMTIMRYHPGSNTSYVLFCNFLDADDLNGQGEELSNMVRKAIKAVKASQ
jgi:D-alanyl-D-alanine carboxypeptidase